MKAFIKSRSEFKTTRSLDTADYEIVLASIYDSVSHIKVLGNASGCEGDYLIAGVFIGVIKQAAYSKGITSLTCNAITTIFERPLVYTALAPSTTIESFIKSEIEANFVNLSDAVYAMPYISVAEATTQTNFVAPEVDDNGLYNIKSYIARVRRISGVFVVFSVTGNTLSVEIAHRAVGTHNIDFAQSAHELIKDNYSLDSVAKITAVVDGAGTDYYLLADGTVTTTPGSSERATGTWKVITPRNAESVLENVQDEFAKNSHSHSIEFFSEKPIPFYSRVTLRMNGRVLSSYISQITTTSKDNRRFYKSGELKTTFTEKQQEVI